MIMLFWPKWFELRLPLVDAILTKGEFFFFFLLTKSFCFETSCRKLELDFDVESDNIDPSFVVLPYLKTSDGGDKVQQLAETEFKIFWTPLLCSNEFLSFEWIFSNNYFQNFNL